MFSIYDGREHFYQWDLDRKLIVYDETIKEVHFCNKTDDCSLVCEVYTDGNLRLVNVPNILLQDNWRINVYGYDDKYTKHEKKYDVKSRTRPADYIYTETEIKTFGTLEKRMEELENAVSIEGIENAVKDYLEENPETFVVTVAEHDATYPLTYSTDKTSLEIMQAWRDGKTIFCKYNKSGISLVLTLSLVTRDYAYFFQNGGVMDINGFKIRSGFGVCIQGSTVTTCDFQPAYLQDIQSSGGGVIYVNLQEQENGTATADMTSEEIYSAYMENKYIVCKYYGSLLLPLVLCNQETAFFILNMGEETLAVNISGNTVEYGSTEIYATKDDLAMVIEEANQYFATKEEIPSIEGLATEDYVDEAISNIEVSGGSGIDVTGAKVGQTIKISEVNNSGVPTAWESVDFPSGGSEENWEFINYVKLTEDSGLITFDTDSNGNPFCLKSVTVGIYSVGASTNTKETYLKIKLNNVLAMDNAYGIKNPGAKRGCIYVNTEITKNIKTKPVFMFGHDGFNPVKNGATFNSGANFINLKGDVYNLELAEGVSQISITTALPNEQILGIDSEILIWGVRM